MKPSASRVLCCSRHVKRNKELRFHSVYGLKLGHIESSLELRTLETLPSECVVLFQLIEFQNNHLRFLPFGEQNCGCVTFCCCHRRKNRVYSMCNQERYILSFYGKRMTGPNSHAFFFLFRTSNRHPSSVQISY